MDYNRKLRKYAILAYLSSLNILAIKFHVFLRRSLIQSKEYRLLIDLLKSLRQERNITQEELAKQLKTDQSFVSKYERRERRLDLIEVRSITRALGKDFQEFIAEFEKRLSNKEV
jgi:DNA-binding transcriptional regulator YiaG